MKAKTFENLIRKIVREEIDYALHREIKSLKEDLREEIKPTIIEQTHNSSPIKRTTPLPLESKNSLKSKIMGNNPIQPSKHNFSGNNTLNDLLNETAMGDTRTESNNIPANLSSPFSSAAPLSSDTTGMPVGVANAVNRDYSGLMEAINKKKR